MSRRVVPVSTLVHYLKEAMEGDPVLHGVLVEGEVSNLRKPYSGHWYFSLKDDHASISCVMFRSANARVSFPLKNGDQVILRGDVSVYEAGGSMQIIASSLQPSGIGDLYLQLEALKKKLSAEGLFAEEHKKKIPVFPDRLGLITGNNTAAREDVLITLKRRWPLVEIHEYPCAVQGKEAAPQIIASLKKADMDGNDVLLLVRGGGSLEDLWCFNDEALARTIYDCRTPIITGVGHEIDFTIADYVADLRANTPTGAAEAAVPDKMEVEQQLGVIRKRMISLMQSQLNEKRIHLDHLAGRPVLSQPEKMVESQHMQLKYLKEKLMTFTAVPMRKQETLSPLKRSLVLLAKGKISSTRNILTQNEEGLVRNTRQSILDTRKKLQKNEALLDAYSPLKVLSRGYAVASLNGHTIDSVTQVEIGSDIDVRLQDGRLSARVLDKGETPCRKQK